MVRVVTSKIVDLPREEIFSAIKEIDKLPTLFPDKYKSFKIIDRSDNHILTEEIVSISGKEIEQKVKHTLETDRMLRSEIVEGDTKGTILIIELNPKSDSVTEIRIDADIKYGKIGAVLGIFAKYKIKNEMDKLIDQLSKK
jgi:ribosome-associated toxin RatA of RatAB toxin-antitoxin module